jgi:hypothetical protein
VRLKATIREFIDKSGFASLDDKLDNAALTHPNAQSTRAGDPGTRGRS